MGAPNAKRHYLNEVDDLPEIFFEKLENWKELAKKELEEAAGRVLYYSKNVATEFTLGNKRYRMLPSDIFPYDAETNKPEYGAISAYYEGLTLKIGRDLKEIGATDIRHFGDLD